MLICIFYEGFEYVIAKACTTAVTDDGLTATLHGEDKDKLFVLITKNNLEPDEENPKISRTCLYYPDRIAKKIEEDVPCSSMNE